MDETSDVEPAAEIVDGEPADDHTGRRGQRVEITAASFSGPLPPPEVLGAYDEKLPGLAREIVDQWKLETSHRHRTIDGLREVDKEAMREYYKAEKRGQLLSFLLFLAVTGLVALAIALKSDPIGIAALLVAGGSAVTEMRRRRDPPAQAADANAGDEIEAPSPSRGAGRGEP